MPRRSFRIPAIRASCSISEERMTAERTMPTLDFGTSLTQHSFARGSNPTWYVVVVVELILPPNAKDRPPRRYLKN